MASIVINPSLFGGIEDGYNANDPLNTSASRWCETSDKRYNTLLKFSKNDLSGYLKKHITSASLEVIQHAQTSTGGTIRTGGSVSWLNSSFSESTTWNTQPSSGTIVYKYAEHSVEAGAWSLHTTLVLPIYHSGFIGPLEERADMRFLDQLWIGLKLGNDVPLSEKHNTTNAPINSENDIKLTLIAVDWNPILTARFPTSDAYVKSSIANSFSVSFDAFDSIDYPTAQTITYEIKDTETSVVTSHTATVSIGLNGRTYVEWTVPANTLTNGKDYQFRAKITTDDGETGWSEWTDFTTRDATPGIPMIIAPQAKYLIGSDAITLSWVHNITTGSAQHAFDLQYKQAGSWTDIVVHQVSDAQSYALPPNFFAAGQMYWRVRTYNTDDVAGDWGTSSANVVQAKPITPILYGITTSPRLSASWQSTGQQAFRFTVENSSGTAYDSGDAYGVGKSITINDYLPDGNYTIRLKIQNGLGIWSDYAEQTVRVQNSAQSGDDYLTAAPVFGGVRLDISLPNPVGISYLGDDVYVGEVYAGHQPFNAAGTRYILRDGEPIAKIVGTSYVDYTSAGAHEYICRVVTPAGNYRDTNVVTASPLIKYACISRFETPNQILPLKFGEGQPPQRSNQSSKIYSSNHFAGRALPAHDVTEQHDSAWEFSYSVLSREDYLNLYQLFLDGETVLFRDSKGYKAIGTMTSIKPAPNRKTLSVSFTIEESDVIEGIEYD